MQRERGEEEVEKETSGVLLFKETEGYCLPCKGWGQVPLGVNSRKDKVTEHR